MKKINRKLLTFCLVCIMVVGMCVPAYAGGVSPFANDSKSGTIPSSGSVTWEQPECAKTQAVVEIADLKLEGTETKEIDGQKRVFYYYTGTGIARQSTNSVKISTQFTCIENADGDMEIYDYGGGTITVQKNSGWDAVRNTGTATSACTVKTSTTAEMWVEYAAKAVGSTDYQFLEAKVLFTCKF